MLGSQQQHYTIYSFAVTVSTVFSFILVTLSVVRCNIFALEMVCGCLGNKPLIVSDTAVFVLKRDIKLQPTTNQPITEQSQLQYYKLYMVH